MESLDMKKIILLIAIICSVTSCDINRYPSTYLLAEDIEKDPEVTIDALMVGVYAQLKTWSDVMHRCGEYAGDNIMIRGTSTDAFYEFISYSRTPNNYRLQNFWDYSYRAIAQASNIIKMFPEGTNKNFDNKLGECYFVRGMLYFYLCRAYGRPYYQSPETNLGVPIVNGTPDDIFATLPDRSTVKDTYAQAVSDLEKAQSLLTVDQGPAYASKEAAWALLSRIYLYMSGTFDNPNTEYAGLSVEYAEKVIDSKKYSLLPRGDFMRYNTFTPENNKETILAVKRLATEFSGSDHYYGIGGMYGNIGGMGWGEMYASAKYIELLDETGRNNWSQGKIVDARAAFIEPQYIAGGAQVLRFIKNVYPLKKGIAEHELTNYNYMQDTIIQKPDGLYCIEYQTQYKYDSSVPEGMVIIKDSNNKTVTKKIEYKLTPVSEEDGIYQIKNYNSNNNLEPINIACTGYVDGEMKLNRVYPMFYIVKCSREGEESHLHSPVLARIAEMYLNIAEAEAKRGNYGPALTALNTIRERSLPGEGYSSLNATNAEELIEKERTLELAFQAERSYDVYRNGRSMTRRYPGPHDAMEEIMPNDYRTIYFIPQNAINAYPGTLTQNPTSN